MAKAPTTTSTKNNWRVINAWCSYDIANSVYNLIITTALFPIYYQKITTNAFNDDIVNFFGISLKNTVLYNYAIAFAYLLIVIISPVLSGVADYGGIRKRFMQFFTFIGAASCVGLYWFSGNNVEIGILLVSLAAVGYAGSVQFYNSFLPQIATPDLHDKISARGYAWGYAGSMFLLIINLITISKYEVFGFTDKLEALRVSFLEVGLWWFFVAQISFFFIKDYNKKNKITSGILVKGFRELTEVAKKLRKRTTVKRFLFAFFFYSAGVQTVMLVAVLFGSSELEIKDFKLIITILILQAVAIIGAILFGFISRKTSNKTSLVAMLVIWLLVCVGAYFTTNDIQFYFLAAGVGMVMGGIQSQSRSTYSKLIPEDTHDTATYFSFYSITEKLAIVMGMLTFGVIEQITGNMRNSALSMSLFFIVGLVIIAFTDLKNEKTEN